ncbi:NACHT domain-containing protein [Streptomyces sp. NPDC002952]|uniref:NACHT domain-containing protein n=1 Tax=Streptomyces sp. NPDC002952 TaxID=3364673 RepID=UPI00367F152D
MAGLGGRRQRRNWQLIGTLCALMIAVSAVYALWQLSHGGLEPSDTAGVLSLPLGAAGLAATVVALRKPAEGNDAELARARAATLARQVEASEGAVWRQLLGDDVHRINLTYSLHPAAVRPAMALPAGRLAADGPGAASVPDIVTYYRAIRPLRLVVTGAPGAGKTVLALELLLALIDGRTDDDPVPVRIPLSRWDTERQTLPDLLRQRLAEAYDWPEALAASLVRHHLVLPVLDGLDEMDPPLADGSADPAAPRATAVIRALNLYQQGRDAGPLILTCRTRHYDVLAPGVTVLDAARITVAPVATDDARTYLTGRALESARWQSLLNHLTVHPAGHLATVLSTPWRLCLTATVYQHDGDPAELLTLPDADALDKHLLARFIPAATRTTPNPRGYKAQDVHRWLHHLTTHLDPTGTLHPTALARAEATDLVLHELWPLAGRIRVRVIDALVAAFAVLTTFPLVFTIPRPSRGIFAALIGLLAVLAVLATLVSGDSPNRLTNPFTTPQRRKDLAFRVAVGLATGMAIGVMFGVFTEPDFGLRIGIVSGLVIAFESGLTIGFGHEPGTRLEALNFIKRDLLAGLTIGLSIGLPAGLPFGLPAGLPCGLASGLAIGFGFGAGSSHRYAVFLLCSRRRLPFRLSLFLDWAATAGLMRYSGPAYQYRHRELQHWLRQHSTPVP